MWLEHIPELVGGDHGRQPSGRNVLGPISRRIELCGAYNEAQTSGSAPHPCVKRDELATKQACKCDVVRIVGLRPAKLVGDPPRLTGEPLRLPAMHRSRQHPVEHRLSLLTLQLSSPQHRVQCRDSLNPHQRRRDQLESLETGEAHWGCCRSSGNTRVEDQPQRPSRDSATAAAQLGAGVPSSSRCVASRPNLHRKPPCPLCSYEKGRLYGRPASRHLLRHSSKKAPRCSNARSSARGLRRADPADEGLS